MVFAAGILIFCPAFSFAQSRTVRLNETAFAYAKELIVQGRVVIDKKNAWRDHHPTAEGENAFIRAHGFAQYGKWLADAKIPTAAILEGGYSDDLPELIDAFLSSWDS